jgi:capsular polysaccharide biosynthesis protein
MNFIIKILKKLFKIIIIAVIFILAFYFSFSFFAKIGKTPKLNSN